MMNKKGFTLIELLAAIILLAVIVSVTTTSVVGIMNKSKEKNYDLLIDNIKIGAQAYFEECENINIMGSTTIACPSIVNDDVEVDGVSYTTKYFETSFSLNDLLNYGFLKSSATAEAADGSKIKIVKNPKDDTNISACTITISKYIREDNNSVSYKIEKDSNSLTDADGNEIECPDY